MADDTVPVFKSSRLSMRKSNAAALPTYKSMMITELTQAAESLEDTLPSLCLNVDLGRQHILIDEEVLLTGLLEGRTVLVPVGTYGPEDIENCCDGNSTMVTTDLSNLEFLKNDLYTGSLNISIVTEWSELSVRADNPHTIVWIWYPQNSQIYQYRNTSKP